MPSSGKKSAAAAKRRPAKKKAAVTRPRRAARARGSRARAKKGARPRAKGGITPPEVKTAMLVRKPVAQVYEAFVNPDVTSNFWFTRGSGRLEAGTHVEWHWEMYGFSVPVTVKTIEPNQRIVVEWAGYGSPTTIEWTFEPRGDASTFVSIAERGFKGTDDEVVGNAKSSTEGFALVLAGLKAFLEHNIRLNLVADRFPKGIEE